MEAKGKNYLKITGVLELVLGIILVTLLFYIASLDKGSSIQIFGSNPDGFTFVQLALAWLQAGLCIVAGITGIVLANKPKAYKVCMFFGLVLIFVAISNSFYSDFNFQNIMKEICAYIIPVYYYYGAAKNKQSL